MRVSLTFLQGVPLATLNTVRTASCEPTTFCHGQKCVVCTPTPGPLPCARMLELMQPR